MCADRVPIISLDAWYDGSPAGKRAVAEAVDYAASQVGFLGIVGHRFPQETMDRTWSATRAFFDLPEEAKEAYTSEDEREYPYGYVGFGEETLSVSKSAELGKVWEHDKISLPDLKECFNMGPYNPAAGMPAPRLPTQPPQFADAWMEYYRAMEALMATMCDVFGAALQLEPGFFADKIDHHRSVVRALNYPELDYVPPPGQMRASAHTDYGIMTILKPDGAPGGLEVETTEGAWHKVPYVPEAFVVNIGDLMARWTNDRWISTNHRVVTPPQDPDTPTRRQSIAFFANVNADLTVECLPSCVGADNPAKYEPVNAFDFLMEKHLGATTGYRF